MQMQMHGFVKEKIRISVHRFFLNVTNISKLFVLECQMLTI